MTALLRYDAARQAISEARTIDEVRDWEDKAAAVREYGRRARNREMEIDAAEIRVRAQRRRGELLREMKASGQLSEGRKKLSIANDSSSRLTLAELDTTLNESSRSQKLAAIEPDAFERLTARVRARLEADKDDHSFDVLRERDGPVNGARSVMGSRQEPDDSLDYFPTPPWATRALIEKVFPAIEAKPAGVAWDPAAGEGHMAEVLAEYFAVHASDIFDYGNGYAVADFVDLKVNHAPVDWIITNPPFGDLTEKFVLRAFDLAREGVAMFVRLQWLETIGRYEAIFRDHPPTIIAFFAERVNLCKGRWEPDGSTATAYIWLVWKMGEEPRAPFWIPPGQRQALERPGDRERFTAHPVTKSDHSVDVTEKVDPETGEIIEPESRSESNEGQNRATGRIPDAAGVASRLADGRTSDAPREVVNANVSAGVTSAASEQAATNSETAGEATAEPAIPAMEIDNRNEAERPVDDLRNEGGGHVAHADSATTTVETTGAGKGATSPVPVRGGDDIGEIPTFLRRGHPDCIVKDQPA